MSEMKLSLIRLDGGTQLRAEVDQDTVNEYAEAVKSGDKFPALDVFHDGKDYWLAEGFHRYHALRAAGKTTHEVTIRKGSQADAQVFAFGANATHGKPRTRADKLETLKALLVHPKAKGASTRELAKFMRIPQSTLVDLKTALEGERPVQQTAETPTNSAPSDPETATATDQTAAPKQPPAPPAEPLDSVGQVIPEKLRPMFARRQEITGYMGELSTIKATVLKAFEDRDHLYNNLSQSRFLAAMQNARAELSCCLPFAVCGYCKGKGCRACKTEGFIDEHRYKAQPPEMKAKKNG